MMIRKLFLLFLILCFILAETTLLHAQGIDPSIFLNNRGVNRTNDLTRSFRSSSDSHSDSNRESTISIPSQINGNGVYYNIHVLGEVNRPGTYRALPSDRVTDGIKYAGGLSASGSERSIQLRRQGGRTQIIDLFSYKYKGKLDQNPYLVENDILFIPFKDGEFQLEGPVKRPGKYEIAKSVNLENAIDTAGGFTVGRSSQNPIRVIRFDEQGEKQVIKVENDDQSIKEFNVHKGDIIVIPHVLTSHNKFDYNIQQLPGDNIFYPTTNNQVYVTGAVSTPGPYPFQPGLAINSYISQAGPSDRSSIKRAKVISPDGTKKLARKVEFINPGDTIVVPPKTIATANDVVSWFGTITSIALTSFVFVDRFAK